MVGNVRLDVVHTPGHTPEHLSFLVTDTAAADEPIAIVTGDFVFVGDVGRPDLLEKAANVEGTMEAAARTLFRSLQRFKQYPDWLQIWPGHGAGSACGKGLSAVPHSTVGYERRFNWAFEHDDEDDVRAGGARRPAGAAEVLRRDEADQQGRAAPAARRLPQPEAPGREPPRRRCSNPAPSSSTRDRPATTPPAHVPGTINIPLNKSFTTWAGWLLPYDRDFYLIVDERCGHCLEEAARDLAMIGLDRVAGVLRQRRGRGLARRGTGAGPGAADHREGTRRTAGATARSPFSTSAGMPSGRRGTSPASATSRSAT